MNDPTALPTTVLLLGGTSRIALAITSAMVDHGPLHVIVAARPGPRREDAVRSLRGLGCTTEILDFDALDPGAAAEAVAGTFGRQVIDVAVVAQGLLPSQPELESDAGRSTEMCTVNFTSAVVVGLQLARSMEAQGNGVIVALSSVAGVRPRTANYVYGATKAGLDALYTGLRDRLRISGVRVLVVRPGHVFTRMTSGLVPAPFAVGPERVGAAVAAHLAEGNGTVWVPAILGPVMTVLRLLPGPLYRRVTAEPSQQPPVDFGQPMTPDGPASEDAP
ncbi:SDR family NAD(P)-dependent oxidoreductase [Arthrobacter sp.]|uniref:SDR family NAD(P)-dependent oxidoreductase n=1 Tax=Arthrobacter sp. TaxID=1667 RepID=UPI003A8EF93D